jgi:phenylalanyl-tRNA synthetase alpha chain
MAGCRCTVHIKRFLQRGPLLQPNRNVAVVSFLKNFSTQQQQTSSVSSPMKDAGGESVVNGQSYPKDSWSNVSPKILSHLGRNLHLQKYHPLCLVKSQIVDFMYKNFPGRSKRTPRFTVFDNLSPIVTIEQNYDSLLVPKDHPSRKKTDSYYLNESHMLRAHTSAHQTELIAQGMNNFLVVGDVYRRDEIDRTHYPVFHQVEAVSLYGHHEVFQDEKVAQELKLFEKVGGSRRPEKQESHTIDAVMVMTQSLQSTLLGMVQHLFGPGMVRNDEMSFRFIRI